MRNAAMAGNKLLTKLSPKELVSLILQHETDVALKKSTVFSRPELMDAKEAIEDEQWPEYRAYIEILELMGVIHYEARIAALHALWRLSLVNIRVPRFKEQEAEGLRGLQLTISNYLKLFYVLQAALKAIDDTLNCNSSALIQYEAEQLDASLQLYSRITAFLEDVLVGAAYKRSEDTDNRQFFPPLDIASLQPSSETIEKIKACLYKPEGRSVWDIIEVIGSKGE